MQRKHYWTAKRNLLNILPSPYKLFLNKNFRRKRRGNAQIRSEIQNSTTPENLCDRLVCVNELRSVTQKKSRTSQRRQRVRKHQDSDVKSSYAAGIQFCIKCRRHAFDCMKQVYNMDNDTQQRQEVTQEANDNYRDSIL